MFASKTLRPYGSVGRTLRPKARGVVEDIPATKTENGKEVEIPGKAESRRIQGIHYPRSANPLCFDINQIPLFGNEEFGNKEFTKQFDTEKMGTEIVKFKITLGLWIRRTGSSGPKGQGFY